jgi:hypothetical protein
VRRRVETPTLGPRTATAAGPPLLPQVTPAGYRLVKHEPVRVGVAGELPHRDVPYAAPVLRPRRAEWRRQRARAAPADPSHTDRAIAATVVGASRSAGRPDRAGRFDRPDRLDRAQTRARPVRPARTASDSSEISDSTLVISTVVLLLALLAGGIVLTLSVM